MTACRINHLVFWADGVVLTAPGRTVWEVVAPGRKPDAKARLELHHLEQGLAGGTLSPDEFCARAVALGKSSLPGASLPEKMLEQIAPIGGMPEVLEELACRRYTLSLASGYPRRWLMPALERCGLASTFPGDQVWIAAELGGFPALLDALLGRGRIVPGRSLWVDDHSLRTTAALRCGIDAAVFVHARQFYRDLGLWGLVPFPGARPSQG
jgi:beta-phosphoglucomutase-like phosphatase (HAD superfamily)